MVNNSAISTSITPELDQSDYVGYYYTMRNKSLKSVQTPLKNDNVFIAQRSRLRWQSKLTSSGYEVDFISQRIRQLTIACVVANNSTFKT